MPAYLRRRSPNAAKVGFSLALSFLLTNLALAGHAQDPPNYSELPNLHKVNDRLYRGGQPGKGGIQKLVGIGIRTVVNLRGEDELTRAEEAESKAAGLNYFSIPMAGLGRPTHQQISRVMAVIETEVNWPVFVHCKRGADRTGTIIAIYRVTHDQWTVDKAVSEAKRHGQSFFAFRMRDYVSDHYREKSLTNSKTVQAPRQASGSSL